MKDLNVHIKTKGRELEKFEDFCNFFNLSNLIKTDIYFKKNYKWRSIFSLQINEIAFNKHM